MIVKEIASCPLKELKATFDEVVQTKDFSAAATCGVEVLSQERRSALIEKFEQAGLTAILGCGFDPGVTQAYCAYAKKH